MIRNNEIWKDMEELEVLNLMVNLTSLGYN
jgi:hypothetical protein